MPDSTPSHAPFMAFDAPYAEAHLVLFGAPFDGTASFRPGSRFAPAAIRQDSEGIETYSPYLDRDLEDFSLHDAGDLPLFAASNNIPHVLTQIREYAHTLYVDRKRPLMIGGDHLTTLPAVEAAFQHHPDLCLIQIDAHTDLAENYLGDRLSHASVIRRVWELLGDDRIFQLGIRSGPRQEFVWAKEHTSLHPFDLRAMRQIVEYIGERPVYLTLDIDILDPSVAPGTGTPEPGGLFFSELIEGLIACQPLNIVGADLVEVSPHYDPSGITKIAAVTLLRELALLMQLPMKS